MLDQDSLKTMKTGTIVSVALLGKDVCDNMTINLNAAVFYGDGVIKYGLLTFSQKCKNKQTKRPLNCSWPRNKTKWVI